VKQCVACVLVNAEFISQHLYRICKVLEFKTLNLRTWKVL